MAVQLATQLPTVQLPIEQRLQLEHTIRDLEEKYGALPIGSYFCGIRCLCLDRCSCWNTCLCSGACAPRICAVVGLIQMFFFVTLTIAIGTWFTQLTAESSVWSYNFYVAYFCCCGFLFIRIFAHMLPNQLDGIECVNGRPNDLLKYRILFWPWWFCLLACFTVVIRCYQIGSFWALFLFVIAIALLFTIAVFKPQLWL